MSDNSRDRDRRNRPVANLYERELRKRTALSHERIGKFINRMSEEKICKHLDLLVGDIDRYDYSRDRHVRYAAEEEFMWITDGDIVETVEMLLGSELVNDADPEALRREIHRTFHETSKSIYSDPSTWYSNRKQKIKDQ